MEEKQFPILIDYRHKGKWKHRTTVPWSFLSPYEEQARNNHGGQSLARLAERGGLGPSEMLAIVNGVCWSETKNIRDEDAMDVLDVLIDSGWTSSND